MTKLDDRVPPAGPPDDDSSPGGFWRWLARLRADLLNRAWADHDRWTEERGYQHWRSRSGFTAYGRDPRFNHRQQCWDCGGTGRHPIAIDACGLCDGTGVVTLPFDDPDSDLDEGQEPR